jgi:hypothetical protein
MSTYNIPRFEISFHYVFTGDEVGGECVMNGEDEEFKIISVENPHLKRSLRRIRRR